MSNQDCNENIKSKKKVSFKEQYHKIKRNIKYFIPLLMKTNPIIVISMIFSALFTSLTSILWVLYPKQIIEELTGDKNVKTIIYLVLSFVIITFILRVLSSILDCIQWYYTQKADFKIDKMFNQKVSTLDYFHIEDPKFADELSYAKKCLSQYSSGIYSVTYALQNIIQNIITISGVIGIVLFSHEYIVIILTLIGIFINSYVYGKYQDMEEEYNNSFVRYNRKQWYFNISILNFRLQKNLRLYDSENMINKHADEMNNTMFDVEKHYSKKLMKYEPLDFCYIYFFRIFGSIVLLLYSVYYKDLSLAVFTMLYSSIGVLDDSTTNLIYSLKGYYKDCSYQDNFINLMEIKSVFKDGTKEITKLETIEFKDVSFKYPRTDKYILKNVSFTIHGKEKVSLVGLNGAGKTTIIKLICRFFEVKEGQILVNGTDINEYVYEDYMRCLSVVFQDFKIISFNIKSNIEIDNDNQEKLYNCLQRAQALEKVISLPDKEYTYINKWFNKKGVEFSGGEMQKFAIARSLYKNADLAILDEPTSSLDPKSEAEIYYHYKDVIGEKLSLFISHRLSSCIFCDRILVLDGNKIVESGTHHELMKEKGLYYEMFTSQAKYYE